MAQALSPANIAKGIESARNPPTQEEIDAAVAALPPEQRAVLSNSSRRISRHWRSRTRRGSCSAAPGSRSTCPSPRSPIRPNVHSGLRRS